MSGLGIWAPRVVMIAMIIVCTALWARVSVAQQTENAVREASQHFRRGVELYGEADYVGALVEFRRAYAQTPSAAALYNVGESQYQLQDYAGALTTFRRYLAESGPNESHRTEVEGNVQVLKTRVGHVQVATQPPGADVAVDDQAVGTTPIEKPILVSVGRRKLVASMAGRLPVTQYIDVAAGDDVQVTLSLPPAVVAVPETSPATEARTTPSPVQARAIDRSGLRAAAWISTGVLAAGATTFGLLALNSAHDLSNARSGLTTSDTLNHKANLTTTYAILGDSLAAAAILVGGLSLYWTLARPAAADHSQLPPRFAIGLGSAHFEMNF